MGVRVPPPQHAARARGIGASRLGYNAPVEKVTKVAGVEAVETRSGKTRYVLRDSDGNEFTTFRPKIGETARAFEGRTAKIEYHEEERNGFQNVYLDAIEAADEPAARGESGGDDPGGGASAA